MGQIPVTLHIIFRSGGLCISMLTGYFVGKRRYSVSQVTAGILITVGIVIATLSAPRKPSARPNTSASTTAASLSQRGLADHLLSDHAQFVAGIGLLSAALLLSSFMGLWQEETYRRHGKQWREGLFYSVQPMSPG